MTLFDIISAVQVMDPRMDVGFGRSRKPLPDDNSPFDVTQNLLPSEVLMIIDISLACEVTWYSGRLLSQTVLISNYLPHLDLLKEHHNQLTKHVLRSYLLGLTKCCSIVYDEIIKDHLRDNEDVNHEHRIMNFYNDIDVTQTLQDLDQAHAVLQAWPNEMEGYRMPLMERLRFRIEYLYSLALLSCSPTTSTISQLQTHLLSASEALRCIRLYSNSDKSISLLDQSQRVKSAFNLEFPQTVSSHGPPRPVEFPKSFYDLIFITGKILDDLSSITQVGLGSSIPDWVTFFHGFSRQEPMPLPFVRSYLLSLFQDANVIALDKNHTLNWFARECISNLSAGRVRLESNSLEINYILSRLAGLLVNYLSAFAANRARGRRILSKSLLEWRALYNASSFNQLGIPHSTLQTIQTLIYYFSIESGLQIILMGFDLELYQHHHDRLSMWWVVERLSGRSCQLLTILSGGIESLETRMMSIIGKLAGAASQISRQKDEINEDKLTNRREIFERRTKYLTAFQASFEHTNLIDELELSKDLLNYQSMVDTKFIDKHELQSSLQNVHVELKQIYQHAHLHKKIGLKQFKFFIHELTKATEDLICKNYRHQDASISIERLKISGIFDDGNAFNDDEENPKDVHLDLDCNHIYHYTEASKKWFLT